MIGKLEEENKVLKAQNEKACEKIATKKINSIETSSKGPHHPDNPIEAKGNSPTNKAAKITGSQSKKSKQQEVQGNVIAKTGDPGSRD